MEPSPDRMGARASMMVSTVAGEPRHPGRARTASSLRSDSTPSADSVEPLPEVATKHFVFGISTWVSPNRPEASHQPRNPIGCLECLITVAFEMEGRLDEMLSASLPRIHAACGRRDQRRSLIVFIENQDKICRR